VNTTPQNNSAHFVPTREIFSVEGARVTLDARHGWQCTCAAHRADIQCPHIEQAHGLRRMRGEKREADTIELELSAAELHALSDALAPEDEVPHPAQPVPVTKRRAHGWDWTTWVAALAIATVSSGATYFAVKRGEATGADAQPLTSYQVAAEPEPAPPPQTEVRFVNPFDETETFQFPPGTSEISARDAVAELLLKRAQERLAAADELRGQFSNADDRSSGRASILARGN